MDCRDTIVLQSSVAMTKGTGDTDPYQFEIYPAASVTGYSVDTGYTLAADAKPLTVRTVSADAKTITYAVPDTYTLNGTADADGNAETETGVTTTSADRGYVLVFRSDSDNTFQNATVTVDVMTEAKQHRNTGSDWTSVATESFTLGGQTVNAVPAKV